jgi:hypothetical protein
MTQVTETIESKISSRPKAVLGGMGTWNTTSKTDDIKGTASSFEGRIRKSSIFDNTR